MEIAKLTSKGQITIPKAVREELGVTTGDKLLFIRCENGFVVRNGNSFDDSADGVVMEEEYTAPVAARPAPRAIPARPAFTAWNDEDDYEPPLKSKKDGKDKDKDKDKDKKKKKKKKK